MPAREIGPLRWEADVPGFPGRTEWGTTEKSAEAIAIQTAEKLREGRALATLHELRGLPDDILLARVKNMLKELFP